jgi:hypothetical protein
MAEDVLLKNFGCQFCQLWDVILADQPWRAPQYVAVFPSFIFPPSVRNIFSSRRHRSLQLRSFGFPLTVGECEYPAATPRHGTPAASGGNAGETNLQLLAERQNLKDLTALDSTWTCMQKMT